MQGPSYHLEGVIHSRDELEDFSGPLDLILMLLSKNKIEIRDISISQLLDQYLEYLEKMKEMDLEIASEFVQMASHLTFIKTRMLLTEEKEVAELDLLVSALEQLQNRDAMAALRETAPQLGNMAAGGLRMLSRGPLPRPEAPYDYRHRPTDLVAALAPVLLRGASTTVKEEYDALRRATPKPIVYGVREKSRQLLALLARLGSATLQKLLSACRSRSELVATFLSILELCAGGQVLVTGTSGDYTVSAASDRE